MTAFLIVCIVLFVLSIISNTIYIVNAHTESKGGSVIGLIIFSGMIVWAISLLF